MTQQEKAALNGLSNSGVKSGEQSARGVKVVNKREAPPREPTSFNVEKSSAGSNPSAFNEVRTCKGRFFVQFFGEIKTPFPRSWS